MFEERRAKKAAQEYQEAHDRWQAQRAGYAELLKVALSFKGIQCKEIMLGAGEALYYKVTGAALVEDRSGPIRRRVIRRFHSHLCWRPHLTISCWS